MAGTFEGLSTSAGDIAQVLQFFAALYFGAPLIGTYGESSHAALLRRWNNCRDALGKKADSDTKLSLAEDNLDNLRLAIDRPMTKGGVKLLLALGGLHLGISLLFAAFAAAVLSPVVAFCIFAVLLMAFLFFGARGVSAVLSREQEALNSVVALEIHVRSQ